MRRCVSAVFALVTSVLAIEPRAHAQQPPQQQPQHVYDDQDDSTEPGRAALRWQNQLRETFAEYGPLWWTRTQHGRGVTTQGNDVAIGFGATPNLKFYRIGGAYAVRGIMLDDKSYLLASYTELTGGFRWGPAEIYSFAGVSWLTLGAAHASFALGGLSPRAGLSAGLRVGPIAVHGYVATEYNFTATGMDEYRATNAGIRLSLLSIGY